jgi:hypothetical protein
MLKTGQRAPSAEPDRPSSPYSNQRLGKGMDAGETGMHFALVTGERVKVTPFARASQATRAACDSRMRSAAFAIFREQFRAVNVLT